MDSLVSEEINEVISCALTAIAHHGLPSPFSCPTHYTHWIAFWAACDRAWSSGAARCSVLEVEFLDSRYRVKLFPKHAEIAMLLHDDWYALPLKSCENLAS